ncbi:MAG: SIS domain-containing protein [Rhodobacteraceae bacterium]|nr:SIS domain-containing protein [Paracoccaceae bacterium]
MRAESAQALGAFVSAAQADHTAALAGLGLGDLRAIYTVARGSSDAAATILAYEFMAVLGLPVTSLPPSIFSLGRGVDMTGVVALLVSQSGGSDDLVRTARGIGTNGGTVIALTNQPGSPVERVCNLTLPIGAGPELAVPATKSVTGAIGAGLALLRAFAPGYAPRLAAVCARIEALDELPAQAAMQDALIGSAGRPVYIIGRGAGYGAAQETALKIKECCAIHAEAYSASEVLHGPLQLATKSLIAVLLDTGNEEIQDSLDTAQNRLEASGGTVMRLRAPAGLVGAPAAAYLLAMIYPAILEASLALGHDPDRPSILSKVTQTT